MRNFKSCTNQPHFVSDPEYKNLVYKCKFFVINPLKSVVIILFSLQNTLFIYYYRHSWWENLKQEDLEIICAQDVQKNSVCAASAQIRLNLNINLISKAGQCLWLERTLTKTVLQLPGIFSGSIISWLTSSSGE